MAKLSDAQILAAISAAEETALGSVSGAVSADRADAVDRYYGKAYGDEVPGRSSVVSRDVADVVEGVVANVVKPILSGDSVVQFTPQGPEDEAAAQQEGDYCHDVAFNRNNGFVWVVSAVKDALLTRVGYVKADWEVRSDQNVETYDGLSDDELNMLVSEDEVEVLEHSEYPDPVAAMAAQMQQPQPPAMAMMQGQSPGAQQPPQVPMLHDVKIRVVRPKEFVKIEPVPGDEVLVSDHARTTSLQDLDFVQHRPRKSISELRQAGYIVDDDIVDDEQGETIEELGRQRFGSTGTDDDSTGLASRRRVMFKESYIRIDKDGDGVAELRRICTVGQTILRYKNRDGKTVLADEECDIINLAGFTGVLVPHQHLGMSVYDLVQDIARIKTALLRSYLDNRRLQNDGRWAVDVDRCNVDDFLVSRPGGVVRGQGNPAEWAMPLVAPDTSTGALQGLEYLDSIREQRTGYTRNSAGIDNDALTNRTASGMSMQLSQSQLRLEMIARTIAETGLIDTFRIIHALTLKHSTKADKARLNGKWVEVNPREWVRRSDIRVSLGIGIGTPEQQLAKLMGLFPVVQQAQAAGLVGVQQVYNLTNEAFKLSGYKSADKFLKTPETDPQTGQPKEPQPPPPPEIQVEQMRQQGKQAELQATQQADAQRMQAEQTADAQKFQAEQVANQAQAERDAALKREEMQMQLQVQAANDARQAELDRQKMRLDVLKMEKEFEFKRWEVEYTTQHQVALKSAEFGHQASMAEADRQPPEEKDDGPIELKRDSKGRLSAIKKGGKVRKIDRDPNGRMSRIN